MKNIYFYDQYNKVKNEDGTLLHPSSGITILKETNVEDNQLSSKIEQLYNECKLLGTITDKIINFSEGYAEFHLVFPDKKDLNRCIYCK